MEHPWGTKEIAMPGGRLTQQDRRQIALGLAEGQAVGRRAQAGREGQAKTSCW
ncbi:hypothetical protein [Streptosporangium pseudovulgare]|uniref:hypothetical protein n=1 Tax=Streptosporangium pseudovulgare TaxID=35765 RepID=UPI001671548E|nr:hypothetical protein [Streptosporangium pseudovulgare]